MEVLNFFPIYLTRCASPKQKGTREMGRICFKTQPRCKEGCME
jgi:hypothetical protein